MKRKKKVKGNLKIQGDLSRETTAALGHFVVPVLLIAIFSISLYFRAVIPYDYIFNNGTVYFSTDAMYHMRLVENTIHNFPDRLTYDPFTNYPYGSTIEWGPAWTLFIATASMLLSGSPGDMQRVNTIAAFIPPVIGALVIFPVYVLGRQLGGRLAGILAALLIATLPGIFMYQSLLGSTDHHVAEVLLSTTMFVFLAQAIRNARGITFQHIQNKDISALKKPLLYSMLAGMMYAMYQLTWVGAALFGFIIVIFATLQYVLDHTRGESADYLAVTCVPVFLISLIVMLPFLEPDPGASADRLSYWFRFIASVMGILAFGALSGISHIFNSRKFNRYYFPLALAGILAAGMAILKLASSTLFDTITRAPALVFTSGKGLGTVQEAQSIFSPNLKDMFWTNFPVTGILRGNNLVLGFMLIVLAMLAYKSVRESRPVHLLVLVWSIAMLIAVFAQARWSYYFAVNASLIAGYFGGAISSRIFTYGGWDTPDVNFKNIEPKRILSLVLVVVVFSFIAGQSLWSDETVVRDLSISRISSTGYDAWLDAMLWMKNNTPEPGLDYYGKYDKPPYNTPYQYPESAYGVMSWWDNGHKITYWAHRIPVANPFQEGIGGGAGHSPGASTFFTARTEEEANMVLAGLNPDTNSGVRYVVSDAGMAYYYQNAIAVWNEDTDINDPALKDKNRKPDPEKYYWTFDERLGRGTVLPGMKSFRSMEGRLHIFDGSGLAHYRLVHESASPVNNDRDKREELFKATYIMYGYNISIERTGFVKVFEYVKGARVMGTAPASEPVTIQVNISTNLGRTFSYSQAVTSNGSFAFIVPYSTEGPILPSAGGTLYDVSPVGAYTISSGNITGQARVTEQDVLDGNTITVDLYK